VPKLRFVKPDAGELHCDYLQRDTTVIMLESPLRPKQRACQHDQLPVITLQSCGH
jgi:hypothetical protein